VHQKPPSREPSDPNADTASERCEPDSTGTIPREAGGPKGPEPTRYGDWEKNGRCIDF